MRHRLQPGQALYKVRVAGHVARHWLAWISRLQVTWEQEGSTLIECAFPDQAALHGLLARIRDLGLTLLSVERVPTPHEAGHFDANE